MPKKSHGLFDWRDMKHYQKALRHAVSLNAETETVFTDGQGTWFGARLDNHPTTAAFEVCRVCEQIDAHEEECPEGYHPVAAIRQGNTDAK